MLRNIILVSYKLYCLFKNHRITFSLSLIAPVVMFIVTIQLQKHRGCRIPPPITELSNRKVKYFCAPKTPFTEKLIKFATVKLNNAPAFDDIEWYADKELLVLHAKGQLVEHENAKITLILFENVTKDETPPQQLNYKIRVAMDETEMQKIQYMFLGFYFAVDNFYWTSDFLPIQYALNFAYMDILNNKDMATIESKVEIKPNCLIDRTKDANVFLLCMFIFGTEMLIMSIIKNDIIQERQQGLISVLGVNNLSTFKYWLGWYLAILIPNMFLFIFMTFTFDVLIWKSDIGVVIFILVMCIHSCLLMGMAFIIFLNGIITYSLLGLGVIFYMLRIIPHEKATTVLWYLIPSITLGNLMEIIFHKDRSANMDGLQWVSFVSIDQKYNESVLLALCMYLYANSVIYVFLIWYFHQVLPGPHRYAYPWNFLCYHRGNHVSPVAHVGSKSSIITITEHIEKNTQNWSVSIRMKKVCRRFGDYVAVDNFSIDIYNDQITAILGGYDAGKSTLLSMLVGNLELTSGSIEFDGLNISTNRHKIHKRIGFCPEQSALVPYMTVQEHLIYFGIMKGLKHENAITNAKELMTRFGLLTNKNIFPKNLPSGMQRRLQLLIAVCGPKIDVIVLDEPSASVDLDSKMEIWRIIQSFRKNRTIVFTTSSMEEANAYANQMVIMSHGVLQYYGTPTFLKNIYGTGYDLRVVLSEAPSVDAITAIIVKSVPQAEIKLSTGSLLLYQIPTVDSTTLSNLFSNLEDKKKVFNIISFGLSLRSVEYVFIKLQPDEEHIMYQNKPIYTNKSGCSRYMRQIIALHYNFFSYFSHRLAEIFLCILAIGLATVFVWYKLAVSIPDYNSFALTFGMKVYPNGTNYYSQDDVDENLGTIYQSLVPNAIRVSNLTTTYEKLMKEDYFSYVTNVVIGTEFTKTVTTGRYSLLMRHSSPQSLNAISNTLLKSQFSQNSIVTTNEPIESATKEMNKLDFNFVAMLFLAVLQLPFLIFIHDQIPIKNLQLTTGIGSITYWLFNILIEFFICGLIISLWTFAVLKMDTTNFYSNYKDLGALLGILYVYILMICILASCLSLFFDHWYTTLTILFCIDVIPTLLSQIVEAKRIIDKIVWFLPEFGFRKLVFLLDAAIFKYQLCEKKSEKYFENICNDLESTNSFDFFCCKMQCATGCRKLYIQQGEFLKYLEIYGATALVYLVILILLEWSVFGKFCWCATVRKETQSTSSDVNREIIHVKENWGRHPESVDFDRLILLVNNLKKSYFCFRKMKYTEPLKGISFGVQRGECFGVLGKKGSGKSTIIKILTGQITPSSGGASIQGWHLGTHTSWFLDRVGYCPQNVAVNCGMTVYQHLKMFALSKGVPYRMLQQEINFWIDILKLQSVKNNLSGDLSRGSRRKLCIANALIGNPDVIFLDEPTLNLDPVSRSNVWSILAAAHNSGQSLLLMTESMDECEALCQRLTIMVHGVLKCIGKMEYLKKHYMQGYTILIHLDTSASIASVSNIMNQMREKFQTKLEEHTSAFMRFSISDGSFTLSYLFAQMEKMKSSYKDVILEFTITDTSLDDLYATMAQSSWRG